VVESVVHVDVEALVEDEPGRAEIESGPRIVAETARRLLCDARLTVSLERAGATLDVGRRRRTVPPAMRRAIRDRDQGTCRWPGCGNRKHLQVHHRLHWARHRGRTSKANALLVCLPHHRALHEGGWHADGAPDGVLTFVGPGGRRVPEHAHAPPSTDPCHLARIHALHGPPIGPDTIGAAWGGESLDLNLAVTALACVEPRAGPG
jgi:hypothetical protein